MYNYYKIAMSPQEQTRSLVAISSTPNKDRLNRYDEEEKFEKNFFFCRLLNEGLTSGPNSIKRQDYFAMIAYMSRQPNGREAAWKYYTKNYQKLVKV